MRSTSGHGRTVLVFDPEEISKRSKKPISGSPFAVRLMDCCSKCVIVNSGVYHDTTPDEALRSYWVKKIMKS